MRYYLLPSAVISLCRVYTLTKYVLEAEIDRLVYELYDLTEEEIAVVEGKERNKSQ